MRSKHLSLLTFAIIAPLLMANSPEPIPSLDEYNAVSINCELFAHSGDDFTYKATITNTGNRYIPIYRSQLSNRDKSINIRELKQRTFGTEVLVPGDTKTYQFTTKYATEFKETDSWYCYAYNTIDPNVKFSNVSIEHVESNKYKFNFTATNTGDYFYHAIVQIDYQGTTYAFSINMDNEYEQYIETISYLDVANISITNVIAVRSIYQPHKNSVRKITYYIVIPVVAILLVIGAAIAIPLIIFKKRERKNHAHAQSVIHGEKDSDNK